MVEKDQEKPLTDFFVKVKIAIKSQLDEHLYIVAYFEIVKHINIIKHILEIVELSKKNKVLASFSFSI